MKQQLLKWWPVIVGVCAAIIWIVTSSMKVGALKAETEYQAEAAKSEREDLKEEDVRIYLKIDRTDKKLNKLKKKVDSTSDTVIKIETNQSIIIKNQERILNKLERR